MSLPAIAVVAVGRALLIAEDMIEAACGINDQATTYRTGYRCRAKRHINPKVGSRRDWFRPFAISLVGHQRRSQTRRHVRGVDH